MAKVTNWTGTISVDPTLAGNWSNGLPADGDTVTFGASASGAISTLSPAFPNTPLSLANLIVGNGVVSVGNTNLIVTTLLTVNGGVATGNFIGSITITHGSVNGLNSICTELSAGSDIGDTFVNNVECSGNTNLAVDINARTQVTLNECAIGYVLIQNTNGDNLLIIQNPIISSTTALGISIASILLPQIKFAMPAITLAQIHDALIDGTGRFAINSDGTINTTVTNYATGYSPNDLLLGDPDATLQAANTQGANTQGANTDALAAVGLTPTTPYTGPAGHV